MPASKKIFTVENLAEKLQQAQGLVLTDYTGLNVQQINQLRKEIKETGAEYEIVKNTLLTLAAKKAKIPLTDQNQSLTGPTAALWIFQEDPTPLKTLEKFIKETKKPRIKLGLWQGEPITIEKIKQLASLPSLPELQAKLVSTLNSPLVNLTLTLKGNLQKLVLVLKSIQKNKEGGEN